MARAIDRARLFVGYSQIARARAYLQPAHFHLYLDLVELAVAFLGRETRVIWPVPDQIISAQVIEHPANSAGEIVVVVDEEPAGLTGQVVQAPWDSKNFRCRLASRASTVWPAAPPIAGWSAAVMDNVCRPLASTV